MRQSKKRTKNKQELDPKSGKKPKRQKPYVELLKIDFQFTDKEGNKHKPPDARLKVNADCGVGFLIKTETGWKPVKGKLDYLKVKYERKLLAVRGKVSGRGSK